MKVKKQDPLAVVLLLQKLDTLWFRVLQIYLPIGRLGPYPFSLQTESCCPASPEAGFIFQLVYSGCCPAAPEAGLNLPLLYILPLSCFSRSWTYSLPHLFTKFNFREVAGSMQTTS